MTSIKPPAPGSPQSPTESPDIAGGTKSEGADATSFQTALEGAQKAQHAGQTAAAGATSAASQGSASDPIAGLAQDVEAGRITVDQAVDRLVENTLAKTTRHLSADQRTELSSLLRDALMHDPTLSALRGAGI